MLKSDTRLRIVEAAFAEFGEHGFESTTMRKVAARAGCSTGLAYTYFPSKHAIGLALYRQVADEVEREIPCLPAGSVAERFTALMEHEFELLDVHRGTLTALIAASIDPTGPLGTLSDARTAVRSRNAAAFAAVVAGAADAPKSIEDREALGRLVYGVHLLLLLVWAQDSSGDLPRGALTIAKRTLGGLVPILLLPAVKGPVERLDAMFGASLQSPLDAEGEQRAQALVARLMRRRRVAPGTGPVDEAGQAPHLVRIRRAIAAERPLELALPGFSGKSPNPRKSLGILPDMAEFLALRSLQGLCDELAALHPPGVRLILCTGGGVFGDLWGATDHEVAAYDSRLEALLAEHPSIERFDLSDAFGSLQPAARRDHLMQGWGEDAQTLRERTRRVPALGALLDGLQRVLFEDRLGIDRRNRTSLRPDAGVDALELLRRTRAWTRLVDFQFPDAVRLSIHPQPALSDRLGVHLVPTKDPWLTPRHGVVLLGKDGFELVARHDAEGAGARLIAVEDRPSHFES